MKFDAPTSKVKEKKERCKVKTLRNQLKMPYENKKEKQEHLQTKRKEIELLNKGGGYVLLFVP